MKVPLLASLFSQQASPRLWLVAQRMIGGTPDKQRLFARYVQDGDSVVEVGCSIGNVARVLISRSGVSYLGLDIDTGAIQFAKRWFAGYNRFSFDTRTLNEVSDEGLRFDLVCVTGVLHHVPDQVAMEILRGARSVAKPGGRLLMFDPVPLKPGDGIVYRIIHRLEQGEYLRSPEVLRRMIADAGFSIDTEAEVRIGPGIVPWPKIMSLSLITGVASISDGSAHLAL
jgi:2-polyprenyl-3-methyl-5-hydroxy-6-metoxy-1,4-benzoquinol methylase